MSSRSNPESRANRRRAQAEGERLYLRELRMEDVRSRYVAWLNDPEVTRYLEMRFSPKQTLARVKKFVQRTSRDSDTVLFAIMLKRGNRHIGNIKIGPINRSHGFADVALMIGEKDCWGKGYASEAIRVATRYGFENLGLNKTEAGMYAVNIGSFKAFLKAGYKQEGVEKAKWKVDGKYVDGIRVGCNKAGGSSWRA